MRYSEGKRRVLIQAAPFPPSFPFAPSPILVTTSICLPFRAQEARPGAVHVDQLWRDASEAAVPHRKALHEAEAAGLSGPNHRSLQGQEHTDQDAILQGAAAAQSAGW